MSREVTVVILRDDAQSDSEHARELRATVDGVRYYDDLEAVQRVLSRFGTGKKKLTQEQQEVLDEIRRECLPFFKGLQ